MHRWFHVSMFVRACTTCACMSAHAHARARALAHVLAASTALQAPCTHECGRAAVLARAHMRACLPYMHACWLCMRARIYACTRTACMCVRVRASMRRLRGVDGDGVACCFRRSTSACFSNFCSCCRRCCCFVINSRTCPSVHASVRVSAAQVARHIYAAPPRPRSVSSSEPQAPPPASTASQTCADVRASVHTRARACGRVYRLRAPVSIFGPTARGFGAPYAFTCHGAIG